MAPNNVKEETPTTVLKGYDNQCNIVPKNKKPPLPGTVSHIIQGNYPILDFDQAAFGFRVLRLRSLFFTPPAFSYSSLSLPNLVATPVSNRSLRSFRTLSDA